MGVEQYTCILDWLPDLDTYVHVHVHVHDILLRLPGLRDSHGTSYTGCPGLRVYIRGSMVRTYAWSPVVSILEVP